MTLPEVVNAFKRHRPMNEKDAMMRCGVSLRYIDSGSFRNVYQVDNLPLVVKFPLDNEEDEVGHSRHEFRSLRKISRSKRKYASIQKYLPTVYYMSDMTGVILMKKYAAMPPGKKSNKIRTSIGKAIVTLFELDDWDYHVANFGVDKSGNVVLLDLGCLEGYS